MHGKDAALRCTSPNKRFLIHEVLCMVRYKGDTYEFWPRRDIEGDLSQLRMPIDLNYVPCDRSDGSVTYGPRPTYPHVHLLPTYEFFVVTCK